MSLVFRCQNSLLPNPDIETGDMGLQRRTYLFDRLLEPLEALTAVLHMIPTRWILKPVPLLMLASLANVLDFVVGVCVLNLIRSVIFSKSVC